MKKLHLKSVVTGIMLALCLPVMADDCVMHVHTVTGVKVDVTISENAQAALYGGNTEKYPDSVFYTFTGQTTLDNDGRIIPLVEDGVAKGAILYELPLINIEEISFSLPSGVEDVTSDALSVNIVDGIVRLSRVLNPIHVTITDMSGIIEYDGIIDSDIEIDLNRFGSGVYAAAVGELNFKILVK